VLASQLFFLHEVGAFTLIGLIILHVVGVLYHQLVLRDGLLHHMGPF
jgi:cytochrome b561